jgi:signal peptidase I
MVPVKDVVGRALALVWPLERATRIRNPSATFARVPSP